MARELDWNAMQVTLDDASEPNEERWIGIAPKADRLYVAVYTVRDEDTMRIISLRAATNTEIQRYECPHNPELAAEVRRFAQDLPPVRTEREQIAAGIVARTRSHGGPHHSMIR